MIIVGLCFDGGKSRSSKFFQNKYLQFLGRISMALYLIHTPLIYWIKIALQGEIGLAVVGKNPEVEFPAWPAIPLHILVFIHHMFSRILNFLSVYLLLVQLIKHPIFCLFTF